MYCADLLSGNGGVIPDAGLWPPAEKDLSVESADTSTNVRSNFPETWIWTEAMAGCVIPTTVACK